MSEINVYTLQEVATKLNVTRQTIYNYVSSGKLTAEKHGRDYMVTDNALKELLKNKRKRK